ncbi:unnamed protein product, partial [Heterosigma akashiwo]
MFLVTPFGLKDSPYTFMMLMNQVLGPSKWSYSLSYVDDLIIYSKNDFDLHLRHLQDVFDRLTKANLCLKVSKCTFASGSVAFLGHVVGRHGISPDPKKVEAVKNLARPNTKKQVRQFLGMVGFYRSLIKNFSITAAPLHQLTRKVMPERLKWDDECQKAFDALKETITSHPVLRLPDFSLPFILECDASKTGVGAALMQKTEEGEVVAIAYASRLNNSAQRNYSVFDLELLAIVFGVTKYRSYIYGHTVCIRTDHAALTNLMSITRPSGRLARYQMLLSEYSFTTEFKPGRDNYVADCLSRMRNDGPDRAGEIAIPKEQTSNLEKTKDDDNLGNEDSNIDADFIWKHTGIPAQEADRFCSNCINYLRQGTLPEDVKEASNIIAHARHMGMSGGNQDILVHFYDTVGEFRRRIRRVQVVIPENQQIRKDLLAWAHGFGCGGHVGASKTFALLRAHYWWRNAFQDVTNYIRSCDVCQRQKNPLGRLRARPGACQRPVPLGPWSVVHLDGCVVMKTHVMLFVCAYSRYPEAHIFARPPTGKDVAEALVRKVISRWGCPSTIYCDGASIQRFGDFPAMCSCLNIDLRHTTGYNPRSNGIIESKVAAIKALVRSLAFEHPHQWKQMLPLALLIYRCSFNRNTGETPFYLNSGRHCILP